MIKWIKESDDSYVSLDKFPCKLRVTRRTKNLWDYSCIDFEGKIYGKGICESLDNAQLQANRIVRV